MGFLTCRHGLAVHEAAQSGISSAHVTRKRDSEMAIEAAVAFAAGIESGNCCGQSSIREEAESAAELFTSQPSFRSLKTLPYITAS